MTRYGESVLRVLGTGKTTGEVAQALQWSVSQATRRLDALREQAVIERVEDEKHRLVWRRVRI